MADTTATGEIGVGDIYRMRIAMRAGHDGTASSIYRAWYERVRCLNGMVSVDGTGTIRFIHNTVLCRVKVDTVGGVHEQRRGWLPRLPRLHAAAPVHPLHSGH